MWTAEKIYYQGSSNFIRAYQGTELVWEKPSPTSNYITFTAKATNSTIGLEHLSSNQTLEYSYDGNNWFNMTTDTSITLSSIDNYIYVRGVLSSNNTNSNYTQFTMTGDIKASGNINYLWNKDNPNEPLKQYCGKGLFMSCSALKDVSELELPATTLAGDCYYNMFTFTSITTAPALPAETLANNCYSFMFSYCSSLTTAPILPATTLVSSCYTYMFSYCGSLNYIKCLATDISAGNCTNNWVTGVASTGTFVKDNNMTGWTVDSRNGIPNGWTVEDNMPYLRFTSLDGALTPPSEISLGSLATGQTIEYSYDINNWSSMTEQTIIEVEGGQSVYIRGVLISNNTDSNFTTFNIGNFKVSGNINYLWNYNNPNEPLKDYCGHKLFYYCRALSDVSELKLPATALTSNCYSSMFRGCTSLTTAPELPATTLAGECYLDMFQDCTSLTSAPTLPATTLYERCYRNMFRGCTSLTTAPVLPATTLAIYCYSSMFNSCTSLTSAPALPATTLATYCYYYMFENCSALTTAPDLPAETLVNYCYNNMFNGCSSLNNIKCLATDISASNCTYNWVRNVAATGTFAKPQEMSGWTRGSHGIPTNWTVEDITIDFTKRYWFTASASGSSLTPLNTAPFRVPTKWNNGYRVQVDFYVTTSFSSDMGYLINGTGTFPIELCLYSSGFYLDSHYPNSTTDATVNTSDYDNRRWWTSISSWTKSSSMPVTVDCEVGKGILYNMTNGQQLSTNGTAIRNQNYCTTKDYYMLIGTARQLNECYVSDVRIYDDNNTLIHNFQLYPYNDTYAYLDRVTNIWYEWYGENAVLEDVQVTDR